MGMNGKPEKEWQDFASYILDGQLCEYFLLQGNTPPNTSNVYCKENCIPPINMRNEILKCFNIYMDKS